MPMRHACLLSLLLCLVLCSACQGRISRGANGHRGRSRIERTHQRRRTGGMRWGNVREHDSAGKQRIPMTHEDGVIYIPVRVNDVPMRFIFDTGASNISISQREANLLYSQGSLTDEDVLGQTRFQDATGHISEGCSVRLRKVQIGQAVLHDVQASVVMNQRAPLLLGQSALSQFGRISIDYDNDYLIFE